MTQQPTLTTERLLLRPFTPADAPVVQRLAGDRDIAANTLTIPHPYEDGMAEEWIGTHQERFKQKDTINFAITLCQDSALIGAIGLTGIDEAHRHAEMGYWIGKPYWNNGYCTEAAKAILRYGFTELDLNRIQAHHFARNPASGRVMEKSGMTYEGCLRQHVQRWGAFQDLKMYGVLKSEYESPFKE